MVTSDTWYDADGNLTAGPDGYARVEFAEPQRAVTPGQAVVLYQGDLVVGGGTITEVKKGERTDSPLFFILRFLCCGTNICRYPAWEW